MTFHILKSELARRRAICQPITEKVKTLEQTHKRECNLCGQESAFIITTEDRYGLPLRTAICQNCGLIYMVDHLTEDAYTEFYKYYYRPITQAFSKKSHSSLEYLFAEQQSYAEHSVSMFAESVNLGDDAVLLDVGGSTGVVAETFAKALGCRAVVLDPAPDEIEIARSRGMEGHVGMIETFDAPEKYDFIIMSRTIEHLFDFKSSLLKVRDLLKPDGYFYCDMSDYIAQCHFMGAPDCVSKVDHLYWLTLETAPVIFSHVGFQIVHSHFSTSMTQVGFLLKVADIDTTKSANEIAVKHIRDIQATKQAWQDESIKPKNAVDSLRHTAYKARRSLMKNIRSRLAR